MELSEASQELEKYLKLTVDDQVKDNVFMSKDRIIKSRRIGALETMHSIALFYVEKVSEILQETLKDGDLNRIHSDIAHANTLLSLIKLRTK